MSSYKFVWPFLALVLCVVADIFVNISYVSIFLILTVLIYAVTAVLISWKTEPKHPLEFYLLNLSQLALITAPLIHFGLTGEIKWWVLAIYGVLVYSIWIIQLLSLCLYNIVPNKVYDCEYYGFFLRKSGETVYLGRIREGLFLTGVVLDKYDPKVDGKVVKVIFDQEKSKKMGGEFLQVYDERTHDEHMELFTAYVKRADV